MKTKITVFYAILFASVITSQVYAQVSNNWSTDVASTYEYVLANGKSVDPDGVLLALPNNQTIIALKTMRVMEIETQNISGAIFIDEPKSFKGNILGGKYVPRISVFDQKVAFNKIEILTKWVMDNKPRRPLALDEGKDTITSQLANLLKIVSLKGSRDGEDDISVEFKTTDAVINITSFASSRTILVHCADYDKGESFMITFYLDRPWQAGKCYKGGNPKYIPIDKITMERFLSQMTKILG